MRSQTMDPSNKTLIYGQLMTMHTLQLNYDHIGIRSHNSQILQWEQWSLLKKLIHFAIKKINKKEWVCLFFQLGHCN